MAIRDDSYGNVAGVMALTRHLLDGAAKFSDQTRPTLAEVEAFIDRWSATLNVALVNREVSVPVTQPVVKLVCDQWVIRQAAAEVELTQRGAGFSESEDSRAAALRPGRLEAVADSVAAALLQLGVTTQGRASSGLAFTGTSVAMFARGQFDL